MHPEVDINAKDSNALHLAIRKQSIRVIRLLLQYPKIDVNAKSNCGVFLTIFIYFHYNYINSYAL
ncbi:hypothetical protein [Candidatus Mesenet endosymbiont of Agriotes lineatus]|uniref:hypothetical protein n=1 Tax=Candidatus Mesenet endosymbiont of Agriotes lineatus TaxID=3077948 RepID=UPI0030CB46D7